MTDPFPARPGDRGSPEAKLHAHLVRTMADTIRAHGLIEDGDRILVAISGGKDSYTMLDLLWRARSRAPVSFELVAFHLDQKQPGYDGSKLRAWLEDFGAPFEIHGEDTYTKVLELAGEGRSTYCAPCSRFRRGILYTHAERLGCNKLALGHHREDTLQTLLLNLLYAGKLQAMPAKYTTEDGRFEVIRPLIECDEASIARYAELREFPIIPCNLCGSQDGLKRVRVENLLAALEREIPDVRRVMLAALRNVRPTHLLDPDLAALVGREAGAKSAAESERDDDDAGSPCGLTSEASPGSTRR